MFAARGGHFELLRWCRSMGCPWDGECLACAVASGNEEMVAWCRANGCLEWEADEEGLIPEETDSDEDSDEETDVDDEMDVDEGGLTPEPP